jgi:hypothetical protein
LLLPLIQKDGFSAFNLEIFVVVGRSPRRSRPASSPHKFSSEYYYCFLEQYLLLDKQFHLNTHRIVNFSTGQGIKIFMYDLQCKILYHKSPSLRAFCDVLGIHHTSYKKCIKSGIPYLNYFVITNKPVDNAVNANLTLLELHNLIAEQQKASRNTWSASYGIAIEVFDKETNITTSYASASKAGEALSV